jgi:4-diphosphocytidyl-2-C-methyl-D-erythritol kinase
MTDMPAADAVDVLSETAPAKVNLTLRVLRKRPDGYHELESLVTFAALADQLTLRLDAPLALSVSGPTAEQAGPVADNLVLKAVHMVAERIAGLRFGAFELIKRLPAGAGLGGGSSDAAAALRLVARANGLALADPRLAAAALASGADVPVCLDPQPRTMRGVGDVLSAPIALPPLSAVLVGPGFPLATKEVFAALGLAARERRGEPCADAAIPREPDALFTFLAVHPNDLEAPALKLAPAIASLLTTLRAQPGCRLARMSGSGATCFGLFVSKAAAETAARSLKVAQPRWWVQATELSSRAAPA